MGVPGGCVRLIAAPLSGSGACRRGWRRDGRVRFRAAAESGVRGRQCLRRPSLRDRCKRFLRGEAGVRKAAARMPPKNYPPRGMDAPLGRG